jgi:Pao retrotransposon peptidase
MILTKITSNSEYVRGKFDQIENNKIKLIGKSEEEKTLGIYWNSERDEWRFEYHMENIRKTKREAVSAIGKLFNPLTFLLPIITCARVALSEITKGENTKWGNEWNIEEQKKWNNKIEEWKEVEGIRIKRRIETSEKRKIWAFWDASPRSIGVVYYVTNSENKNGQIVFAKSKCVIKNRTTIPRLELKAALLAQKWIQTVIEGKGKEGDNNINICSDSKIALAWIAARRICKIKEVPMIVEKKKKKDISIKWHHIEGKRNPSDMLTKEIELKELKESRLWWNGPGKEELEKSRSSLKTER